MMACSPTGIRNAAHYIDIPNNWIRGSRWAVRVGIFALVACGDAAELPPSTTRTPRERTSKISSPLGPIQVHFAAATGSSRLCTLDDVIPHVALVGGAPVYVNAEVFSSSADRILLAGFPNYIWPTGAVEPVADSIFGIVVDSDGHATAVPKPIPGNLGDLVAIPRPGGGWHVIFAELASPVRKSLTRQIVGLWSGVLDGIEWSNVERLPAPGGYEIDDLGSASLLLQGDTLALGVVVSPVGQILLLKRIDRRWAWDRVSISGGNGQFVEPSTVSHIALVPAWNGLGVLARKNDVTLDTIYQSLYLYTQEDGWREHKVIDGMDPHVTGQLVASPSSELDVITWVHETEAVAYIGAFGTGQLRAITVDTPDTSSAIGFTSRFSRLQDETPVWVTQPRLHDESGELRILVLDQDTIVPLAALEFPHWRLQGSTAAPGGVVVATAALRHESPQISTLILRAKILCTGP